MKHCESCSMPIAQEETYCQYCAPNGVLKSKEEVRAGWIQALKYQKKLSQEEAEKIVDETMPKMPAWKDIK